MRSLRRGEVDTSRSRENARAWLLPYAQATGRIWPLSESMLLVRLRALGVKHRVATIKHGARHSFASYWLAMHGDIDQLCQFLGHTNPE